MDLKAQLHQRQEQRLALLPKMLQSIEVLQMTTVDLLHKIQVELEQNETLELRDSGQDTLPAEQPAPRDEDAVPDLRHGGSTEASDRKQQFLNNLPDTTQSLLEYVELQVVCLDLPAPLLAGVLILAERLDERGLLTASDEELQVLLDVEMLPDAVAILQSLEPRGIGARDTIGAMLLQVPQQDPDLVDIEIMLTRHLDDLARNKLPEVARSLGRSIEEIQGLLSRIERLDPRPGARFQTDVAAAVTPDVVVRLESDVPIVEVDDMVLPDLGISDGYEQMVRDRQTEQEVREYLRDKIKDARGLIDAVEQRKRTLARVTAAIMRHQRDFLEQGESALHPLRMSDVATELDLHPSTVSRAISGKHVQTERGIFPLREFFDGDRRDSRGEGDGAGRLAIKDHIQRLVAAENPNSPLSDDDLVRKLEGRNIRVARRTVAKYRGELDIPSSYRRRTYQD